MPVLIIAPTYDPHATAVSWCISQLGSNCQIVDLSTNPLKSTLSFDKDQYYWFNSFNTYLVDQTVEALWVRRPLAPLFDDSISDYDVDPSSRSWDIFHRSFLENIAIRADLVANNPSSTRRATLKPIQLKAAKSTGFNIPKTIISHNENEILNFLYEMRDKKSLVIAKPLTYMNWDIGRDVYITANTSIIDEDTIKNSNVSICPMIYQEAIKKAYEVRVLVCGHSFLAIKINKLSGLSATDWRMERDISKLGGEKITIPPDVADKCIKFMRNMSIITASIDFIVSENNEWIFLESNESGNFLWMEDINPDIPALDMFSKFLLSRDELFKYSEGDRIHLCNFKNDGCSDTLNASDRRAGVRPISEII